MMEVITTVFSWLLGLFTIWWVWLPIVVLLLYLTYQNHRRIRHIDTMEYVVLQLEVPRSNEKGPAAAKQLFESLHSLLRSKKELITSGELQEHLGFEMVAAQRQIRCFVWVPTHLQHFVESQIYTHFPNIQMRVASHDYAAEEIESSHFNCTELTLGAYQALPIKTYHQFENDPLLALSTTLGKLESPDEAYWVQILAKPTDAHWQRRSESYIRRLKSGHVHFDITDILKGIATFIRAFSQPPEPSSGLPEISEADRKRIEAAEQKVSKPGYQVKIRLAYIGENDAVAKMRMQSLVGTFKQFNQMSANGFRQKNSEKGQESLAAYRSRLFVDKGFILNTEELGTIFHLPDSSLEETNFAWAKSKSAEPPPELPMITGDHAHDSSISAFAATTFRGMSQQFGVYRSDRDRHVYIIGQTGVGKSKLLELFALSDLYHGQGYAIIDPHGDFAMNNLHFVPPSRIQDVVYFNPADTDYPIGFNPMELSDPAFKGRVSAELVNVLRPLLEDVWTTRLEYMLRYIILALLETPGTTMCDITRMLTEPQFREAIVAKVTDPIVQGFWTNEFTEWQQMYSAEAIAPILNKVGAFTANPMIRNIIGQPTSTFNLRHIMDQGKIFVANLSGALLGEESAALLGSLLITKIQQAAMSRTDPQTRRPFYLYVDEFQNFATDSFVPILSEARKYGLSLTMANQYIGQMSPVVRDAVFGNVGTLIAFRVGPEDSQNLSTHFAPRFEPKDVAELHNRNFITAMTIQGEKTAPFTGTTLALPTAGQNYLAEIAASTRTNFATPRSEVESQQGRIGHLQDTPSDSLPHTENNDASTDSLQTPPEDASLPDFPELSSGLPEKEALLPASNEDREAGEEMATTPTVHEHSFKIKHK